MCRNMVDSQSATAENTGRKISAKNRHLRTIPQLCRAVSSQLRQLSTIGKRVLNSNISSTCPHKMANFGPLTAEIGRLVWGTPANFNGFHILALLLQRRRSPEANQTLHIFGRLLGLYTIYTYPGLLPRQNFARCKLHFASKSCILL